MDKLTVNQLITQTIVKLREIALANELPAKCDPKKGLCANALIDIYFSNEKLWSKIQLYMCQWPKFSGDAFTPVPGGFIQYRHYRENDLSMYEGEYGQLRKELALYIAQRLETLQETIVYAI
ncbi:MAG: hypothetical protein CMC55_08575 [Flavobacteriaceae bacterium]|nr:hypothetical protein [Flavobacteriaceae bacterium]|tara:strand:- start:819 stop:1184 length:366 start_codon:yes stop_codon:yes gene_type:complete